MRQTEIQFMVGLQSFRNKMVDMVAIFFHFLFKEEVVFFVCPIILWTYNMMLGIEIVVLLCFTETINGILKWTLKQPRPLWIATNSSMYFRRFSFVKFILVFSFLCFFICLYFVIFFIL